MPQDAIEEIQTVIYNREREGYGIDDWVVYVPVDMMGEVTEHIRNRTHQEVYEKGARVSGHRVCSDPLIDNPTLLPAEIQDLNPQLGVVEDAPHELIRQALEVYGIEERKDSFTNSQAYATRIFFEVEDRHTKLNHEKIQKFGLGDVGVESHTEPDSLERVKFGFRITEEQLRFEDAPNEWVEREFVNAINGHIHSVERSPVYGTRTRTFRFPYSTLDFTHTERIRCGTTYTHYGGVFLYPVDVDAQKMELRPDGVVG